MSARAHLILALALISSKNLCAQCQVCLPYYFIKAQLLIIRFWENKSGTLQLNGWIARFRKKRMVHQFQKPTHKYQTREVSHFPSNTPTMKMRRNNSAS
jgi:hypothetical protein